jgi:uncharacterized protein (TIGR03435 family)
MTAPNKAFGGLSNPISFQPGGRFTGCAPLKSFVFVAYDAKDLWRITHVPDWMEKMWFQIEARAGEDVGKDRMRLMLQSLLEERFKLKLHRRMQEVDSYSLVVAQGGPRLKIAKDEKGNPITSMPSDEENYKKFQDQMHSGNPESATKMGSYMSGDGSHMEIRSFPASMKSFAGSLVGQVGRPVIDKTGISGLFDILLSFSTGRPKIQILIGPDGSPGPPAAQPMSLEPSSGPTVFKALQEQLGLELEPDKALLEFIVIDSVEKPSEN